MFQKNTKGVFSVGELPDWGFFHTFAAMKQRILFVCLGNICRSPAAEEIFRTQVARRGLTDQITTDSAGTYSGHAGELADPRMRRAAAARGYELTHHSRPIRPADFEQFDRIIVMSTLR